MSGSGRGRGEQQSDGGVTTFITTLLLLRAQLSLQQYLFCTRLSSWQWTQKDPVRLSKLRLTCQAAFAASSFSSWFTILWIFMIYVDIFWCESLRLVTSPCWVVAARIIVFVVIMWYVAPRLPFLHSVESTICRNSGKGWKHTENNFPSKFWACKIQADHIVAKLIFKRFQIQNLHHLHLETYPWLMVTEYLFFSLEIYIFCLCR